MTYGALDKMISAGGANRLMAPLAFIRVEIPSRRTYSAQARPHKLSKITRCSPPAAPDKAELRASSPLNPRVAACLLSAHFEARRGEGKTRQGGAASERASGWRLVYPLIIHLLIDNHRSLTSRRPCIPQPRRVGVVRTPRDVPCPIQCRLREIDGMKFLQIGDIRLELHVSLLFITSFTIEFILTPEHKTTVASGFP
ncbi:hypothetical protein E2C01_042001 [Portunus trituberculatus]|uniref:Uncharacterized protein n=1 Tax=Portunus trituberculatus TaxID=210409 RepID=A0A5B7FT68_PORTR|nr:hypothetical protein [Portunus trituberculatus]